ncbi:MAG: transporter [Planctomycetales bacterium]|nr:transporter [Planctomycetales bacterium]
MSCRMNPNHSAVPCSMNIVRRLSVVGIAVLLQFIAFQNLSAQSTTPGDGSDADYQPRLMFRTTEDFTRWLSGPFRPSDEEPLATDRPDFTEASSVVGHGRVMLEGGWTFLHDSNNETRSDEHVLPEFLWRIGLTEKVELRIILPTYVNSFEIDRVTEERTRTKGATDLDLGFKFQLLQEDGWIPELAAIATLSVPAGSTPFRSRRTQPKTNFLYGWDITEDWSIAGSTGFAYLYETGFQTFDTVGVGNPAHFVLNATEDGFAQAHQSVTTGISLAEKVGMYLEWFAFFRHGSEEDRPEHYADGGLTYQFTPNFQVDWRIGFGLVDHAADLFTGTGFAIRW